MHNLVGGWDLLGRTLIVSIVGYVALLVVLRTSGKRTLAKLNVFDFVVVVALGSILADLITTSSTTLVQAVGAFAILTGLQLAFSLLTRRSKRLERVINGGPTLLVSRGHVLPDALRRERVTEEDLRAAVRAAGVGRMEDVDAVVLETTGAFSVLKDVPDLERERTTLSDVEGAFANPGRPSPAGAAERRTRERRRLTARGHERR